MPQPLQHGSHRPRRSCWQLSPTPRGRPRWLLRTSRWAGKSTGRGMLRWSSVWASADMMALFVPIRAAAWFLRHFLADVAHSGANTELTWRATSPRICCSRCDAAAAAGVAPGWSVTIRRAPTRAGLSAQAPGPSCALSAACCCSDSFLSSTDTLASLAPPLLTPGFCGISWENGLILLHYAHSNGAQRRQEYAAAVATQQPQLASSLPVGASPSGAHPTALASPLEHLGRLEHRTRPAVAPTLALCSAKHHGSASARRRRRLVLAAFLCRRGSFRSPKHAHSAHNAG